MRILHVHKYYYERAGAERYMFELMRLQEERGHTVAPFSMHHPKNKPTPWSSYFVSEINTERLRYGFGVVHQFLRALWSREAYKNMEQMLRAFQPDVVHVHNIYTHLSPSILKACKQAGVPVVMTAHDYGTISANYALWDRDQPMGKRRGIFATARTRFIKDSYLATFILACIMAWHRFTHAYRKRIDRYIAISDFMKSTLQQAGVSPKKISTVYNFVDPICIPRASETAGVLYVGRLERYKGLQTLIEAMDAFPGTPLYIAGTGEDEQLFRRLTKKHDNVHFLGFISHEQLAKKLSEVRVAVFPSLWQEPFGLVVVEAMACGTPVIVSDRGALPELVQEGVSGTVFSAGDVHALTEALKPFIANATEVQHMGQAAKKFAEEIGDPERHLDQVLKIYQDIVK